jgi:divalent metal cation (Fe/Co/Zn/Cd) transporter
MGSHLFMTHNRLLHAQQSRKNITRPIKRPRYGGSGRAITRLFIQQRNRKPAAVSLGLVVNIFLALIKTTVGILGHSPALLAEGVNSTSDVAYYIVVAVFMRLSRKPADETHTYGHNQLESIASLVVGAFIITTAIAVFWDAQQCLRVAGMFNQQVLHALWVALCPWWSKLTSRYQSSCLDQQPGGGQPPWRHYATISFCIAAALNLLRTTGIPWADPLVGAMVAALI